MSRKNISMKKWNQKGMTLVEVLVAMAVLTIAIITFLPLGQTSFKNIFIAGKKISQNYQSVGLIEKLVGNDGANGDYEVETLDIPLVFSSKATPNKIVANREQLQSIDGVSILSTPEAPSAGFSTFICNSVTAQMMAFPKHISDDFVKKQISLYAVGFHFSEKSCKLYYTPEGVESIDMSQEADQIIEAIKAKNLPEVNKDYYELTPNKDNNSVATLTLEGDNDNITFTKSPLYLVYRKFVIQIEVDAPTVIMVGEAAADGNYYYYVTSGEKIDNNGKIDEENGQVRIVRKKMENYDPQPGGNVNLAPKKEVDGKIRLSAAMNDVEWVGPGEGNDPTRKDNVNQYGYYNMCGDNGQIRRFWRKPNGNYAWGGDYVRNYLYVYDETAPGGLDARNVISDLGYTTEVSYTYLYQKPADINISSGHDYQSRQDYGGGPYRDTALHSDAGLRIIPVPREKGKEKIGIFDRLFVQTAYSISALTDERTKNNDPHFYTAGDALYTHRTGGTHAPVLDKNKHWMINKFINVYGGDFTKLTPLKNHYGDFAFVDSSNKTKTQGERNATKVYNARDVEEYGKYHKLDLNQKNHITLTSVDSVKFSDKISAAKNYPDKSYTMYCGSIPSVMDIWATNDGVNDASGAPPSEWRATLGVAFKDSDDAVTGNNSKYYKYYPHSECGTIDGLGTWPYKTVEYEAHLWNYANTTASNFSISGICGPENYDYENYIDPSSKKRVNKCAALYKALEQGKKALPGNLGEDQKIFPLNQGYNQQALQSQVGNETDISISYLSHPNALSLYNDDHSKHLKITTRDLSPSRFSDVTGAYEWAFDPSVTIIDSDTICYPADDGTERYFSIAVGYYVGGIAYENQMSDGKPVSVPSVMNNGIVFLRAGGSNGDGLGDGYKLEKESNVYNQFYTTGEYFSLEQTEGSGSTRNTMDQAVSARYWQDVYHPRFYSMSGAAYHPTDELLRYNYIMGHALNDKRLNCVGWGETWEGRPEAMWGASDGTMMSWFLEKPDANGNVPRYVDAEFQSYNRLEYAKSLHEKYDNNFKIFDPYLKRTGWYFKQQWTQSTGITLYPDEQICDKKDNVSGYVMSKKFEIPTTFAETISHIGRDDTHWVGGAAGVAEKNPAYHNAYLDKCSLQMATKGGNQIVDETMITKYGFISPLDSIEDLEYANDTWVAVGTQGTSSPKNYCGSEAVVPRTAASGSWVCVRRWIGKSVWDPPKKAENESTSKTTTPPNGPVAGDCNYIWQAVRISNDENINIEQVTFSNGMWYAMGYDDVNNNNEYDYNSGEHAMLFYAEDPTQPNGTEKGWQLCNTGSNGYTQAYCNEKDAPSTAKESDVKGFKLLDIDGINSVASRND